MKHFGAGVAASALVLGLGTATPALADQPGTSSADIVGVVNLVSPTEADVRVRYSCTGSPDQLALWVSVKQSANGTASPGLAEEGSGYGERAAAWSQGHGAVTSLICNGKTHVGTFRVDRSEFGYGNLQKGDAYVQFCLFDATTPGEGPEGQPISSMEFTHVR